MGAHQRLAIYQDVTPADLTSWLAGQGQALVADAHARDSIYALDLRRPTTLVVGSEAHGPARAGDFGGLRPVAIPMPGGTEPLNVAVATAVILFEAVRQRSTPRT